MDRELSPQEALWELVKRVPAGRVVAYSFLGQILPHPTTGRIVGRWMAASPPDIPWWRVVSKAGYLPVEKRNPYLGITQAQILSDEGVDLRHGKVHPGFFLFDPDELLPLG